MVLFEAGEMIEQSRCLSRAVSDESAPVTHQDQGWGVVRRAAPAPDAQGVPETDRSYERVSNWKVHRTRGSPAVTGVQPLVAHALVAKS